MHAEDQVLSAASRPLADGAATLAAAGLGPGAALALAARLRGGKPVVVKMLTDHLPCGSEVTIDIGPDARKAEIKAKLEAATGVPAAAQKVVLSGINQIVMGDKRWVCGWGLWGKGGLG